MHQITVILYKIHNDMDLEKTKKLQQMVQYKTFWHLKSYSVLMSVASVTEDLKVFQMGKQKIKFNKYF